MVCFDESRVQLIGEVRKPIPPEPGQLERFDYEYRRTVTVNLFVDVNQPWRKVKLTERRTAEDSPDAGANSSMFIIPTPSASASCRTTCRPTWPAPSIKLSRPPKPNAFCAALSSSIPQNTPRPAPDYEFSRSRMYLTVSFVVGMMTSSDAPNVGVCSCDSLPGARLPNMK